jgi:transposase
MEKSQQQVILDDFSLKGWGTRKIQKELTDTLRSDVYSQVQISRWLARFSTGDSFSLNEARPGRPFSILGPPLEHFKEKFSFASARIIAMHFNVSHSTVKDILS